MNVLMVGVDQSTRGGMWTVVENYMNNQDFVKNNNLIYIPTSITECSIPKKLLFTLKAYIRIIKVFNREKIDIVHVHMSERASIKRKRYVMEFAKKHNAKIVLHMHGAEFEKLYKVMSTKKQNRVKDTLDLADNVIILGDYWKAFIGSLIKYPERIKVVYNAVNVPKTYRYDKDSKRVLFLGAVSQRKGIYLLLDALKNIGNKISEKCYIDIYGPDVEGDIVQQIKNRNIDKWVRYCGWLDNENKDKVLEHTMINVLPSYNEGLPMTILEAMSYGVPSISTRVAAIPEAVNELNGCIINAGKINELEDALIDLITNKEKREKLSEQAYSDALNKFSVEKHITIIQKIYEELLA